MRMHFDSTRELHTASLLLRPLQLEDSVAMFDIYADPETMKYWSSEPVSNYADAQKLVREDVDSMDEGNSITLAITLQTTGQVIGKCILFRHSKSNRRAEVGFVLNRKFWRRGLAFEAVAALIHLAFEDLGLHRLEADTDTANAASLHLLEKLGFRREGLFRERWYVYGQWQDSVMLGLLKTDWSQ